MAHDRREPASGGYRPFQSPNMKTSVQGNVYQSTTSDASPGPAASARDRGAGVEAGGGVYRSGGTTFAPGRANPAQFAGQELDDTVLGLTYRTIAARRPIRDPRWEPALRRFARAMVWCLPAGVLAFALASVWGAPTATREPGLVSPGTWLLFTVLGLGLWLAGVVAVAALVAATPMRVWGFAAVLTTIGGVVLLAPVAGIVGLARPAIHRVAVGIEGDATVAGTADAMQAQLLGHPVGQFLMVGGAALLAAGAFAVSGAVLGSRGFSRVDGWLVVLAAAMAAGAAFLGWGFVVTLATMVALAGTLGLAFTISRTAVDGTEPVTS
jgi:hypothetical protein